MKYGATEIPDELEDQRLLVFVKGPRNISHVDTFLNHHGVEGCQTHPTGQKQEIAYYVPKDEAQSLSRLYRP